MADENTHVARTLDDIKNQIAGKIEDANRLLTTANHLADMIGAPGMTLTDFIPGDDSLPFQAPAASQGASRQGAQPLRGSSRSIKPDQFLGDPPLDAAKKYMAMIGHAVHLDEIADAIHRGGAATKGADWRDKLEMSLLKSVYEVVKVQDKTYGLISFYTPEQIAGLRGTRRNAEQKSKGQKRGAKRKGGKPPKATANAMAKPPKAKRVAEPDSAQKADLQTDSGPVH